jgi:hypothetical protein
MKYIKQTAYGTFNSFNSNSYTYQRPFNFLVSSYIDCGVVTNVQSSFDASFPLQLHMYSSDKVIALDPKNIIILKMV